MYRGKVLVGGKNFGCGSSREHAAWAVYDYGFRCVISSFFADIFVNNCMNIGVLPVKVSTEFLNSIFRSIESNSKTEIRVDLPNESVELLETGVQESFEITSYKKNNLQNGFDDIDYLQSLSCEIEEFSKKNSLNS